MAVFNSLGSNYSFGFAVKSLFSVGKKSDLDFIKQHLQTKFNGQVTMTYKGRHALELLLRHSKLEPNSKVAISGFTCYAVYRAVEKAGFKPVFVDVAKDQLQFGLNELKSTGDVGAVIVQNTLGFPADVPEIQKYCKEKNILLIEDLAHSYGAVYENGMTAGSIADLVMLSFSQDKQQDVVAGGALIDRRKSPGKIDALPSASFGTRAKNRVYPLLSWKIRASYNLGFGKFVHFPLKKLGVMANPMSDDSERLGQMTLLAAKLLRRRMDEQKTELEHRRAIAEIYKQELPTNIQFKVLGQPSYLRFPLRVKNPSALIKMLADYKIYISDTWYDSPIAPKNYLDRTTYKKGDCPRAETLSEHLVNLPTHQQITPEIAREICAKIKQIGQES